MVVSVCLFTKYVWVRPLRRATAEAVRDHLLEDVFLKFGVPSTLVCDNGPQYTAKVFTSFLEQNGVKQHKNFYYHPQHNPTERVNRVLKSMIVSYIMDNQRLWDRHLPQITNAINTAKHESTGFSPHQLVFGEYWRGHGAMAPEIDPESPVSFGDRGDLMGKWKDKLKIQAGETKCKESFLEKVPSQFYPYLLVGDKPGYCGILTLCREQPLEVLYGVGDAEADTEGRVLTLRFPKFTLVSVYAPFSGEHLEKLHKRVNWEVAFHSFVKRLYSQGNPLIICGDLNVTVQDEDFAPLDGGKLSCLTAGCTRVERLIFTKLLSFGLVDVFRHLNPHLREAYTFWRYGGDHRANNKGFRFDYFLVSTELLSSVVSATLESGVDGSDHCPITLSVLV
ncbi:hypothetical protein FOCC_FOCC016791 [Frankliniella occidentalis]|nr:hypothetical protein FOCC_FOCC016791 [Frankliniella occidentalis]